MVTGQDLMAAGTRLRQCLRASVSVSFAAVPVYDYRCERCSTQFEVRQSFSDATLTVCPAESSPAACVAPGEGPVKKVFSGVGISFKGDGFYKNDHGSNAKGRRKEKEASSSTDAASSKDAKSDTSSKSSEPKDSGSSKSSSSSTAGAGTSSAKSSTS